MNKITCVLAILAAASTAAVAKDLKQDKKPTGPSIAAIQMTDAEMDKVTAGEAPLVTNVLDFKLSNANAPVTIYIGAPNPVPDNQTKFDSVCCQTPSSPGVVR